MKYIVIIILGAIVFTGCEKDRMENYRAGYSGYFSFETIIRDEEGIVDTIDFSGTIEPIYSNLTDIIQIHFMPDIIIDPVLIKNGQLAGNSWWLQQGVPVSIAGSFHNDKQDIVFSYLLGTEQNYILYQVSGHRQ